jgi:hypothetical protein
MIKKYSFLTENYYVLFYLLLYIYFRINYSFSITNLKSYKHENGMQIIYYFDLYRAVFFL